MKHLLLVAGLLLCAVPSFAQSASATQATLTSVSEPFKGANQILVHTPDSSSTALKKLARAMVLAGIEPDKLDTEIGYLTTKGKPVGQISPATYQYRAVASTEPMGTLLTITGTYTVKLNPTNSMTDSMYWVKGNLSQAKQCFLVIESIAKAYPSGRVGYAINKTQ